MSNKAILGVGLLLALAVGGFLMPRGHSTQAADTARGASPEIGRYQLTADKDGRPQYLFDTATGRLWQAEDTSGHVTGWGKPIEPPKTK
ncbi:MAG TPA: hypothetical protein VFA26_02085 [Gemmataceae bacterium]|nr:hypothetical protein [Gemmataceae bacterium]